MFRIAPMVLMMLGVMTLTVNGQEDGHVYRIKNRLTDKVLAPDADGGHLVQHTPKAKDEAHQWRLVKAKEGNFFMIVNVKSGKAITAPSKDAEAHVKLEEPGKGDKPKVGQLWSFDKLDKMYTIESRYSGYYLDVFNFEKEDGVKIIQQTKNEKGGRGNQIWQLVPVKDKK